MHLTGIETTDEYFRTCGSIKNDKAIMKRSSPGMTKPFIKHRYKLYYIIMSR